MGSALRRFCAVHAAIVCAAVSCPSLRREPWTASRLDEQFDATLRRWLSDPAKGLRIDRSRRTVWVSSIFDWFGEDFAAAGGVLAFVARYLEDSDRRWLTEHAERLDVEYLDYDWTLNDLARTAAESDLQE